MMVAGRKVGRTLNQANGQAAGGSGAPSQTGTSWGRRRPCKTGWEWLGVEAGDRTQEAGNC